MKFLMINLVAAVLLITPAGAADAGLFDDITCDEIEGNDLTRDGDVDIHFEDDAIVFTENDRDETVEITADCQLYINGGRVELKMSGRQLVCAYYRKFDGVMDEAIEIGREGARVGAAGAKIAVKALSRALAAIAGDGDLDKMEDELDDMEGEIEEEAEKLEKRAGKIEKEAEELEELHYDLRERIEELDRLGWF
ncbi:MAG: hypothetical protein R6U43_12085 [Candidatus Krumholzibacteriales bacterium]